MRSEICSGIAGCRCSSVHDVEGVAQGLIQSSSRVLVELTDGFAIEVVEWDRDDVVAADDARLREPVLGTELDLTLTEFFEKTSAPLAYGRNIVNVILVDFRGLDTMGEVAVVVIAGVSAIAVLLAGRRGAAK